MPCLYAGELYYEVLEVADLKFESYRTKKTEKNATVIEGDL
jgi:hypothetical protein